MDKIRIHEKFSLQGTAFDWKLIEDTVNKDPKTGVMKDGERVFYYPRLSQIANHC